MAQSIEDRQKELWLASQKYISGEITIDELEKVEGPRSEQLRNAILCLSRQAVRPNLLKMLYRGYDIFFSHFLAKQTE
jgi:hypothetical protein